MASLNLECGPLPQRPTCCCNGDDGRRNEPPADITAGSDVKCRYGPGVLVADWFERRASHVTPPDDWATVHDLTYTCKRNADLGKDRKAQDEHKRRDRAGLGQEFLIGSYGLSFHKNYTTTNDLIFRIIPHGLCGPRLRKYSSRKDQWLPELDLATSFGSLTGFALADSEECNERLSAVKTSSQETIHRRDFKKPELSDLMAVKRFPRPTGKLNEPQLSHLDIDLDLPFKPRLIKPCT